MGDDPVERGDSFHLGRAGDSAAAGSLDRGVPAGVIGVPVGVPDLGDLPALVSCLAQVGFGIRRVDARGFARFGIVQQVAVIVGQAGELMDFKHAVYLRRLV